jgi:hypothetical protein
LAARAVSVCLPSAHAVSISTASAGLEALDAARHQAADRRRQRRPLVALIAVPFCARLLTRR